MIPFTLFLSRVTVSFYLFAVAYGSLVQASHWPQTANNTLSFLPFIRLDMLLPGLELLVSVLVVLGLFRALAVPLMWLFYAWGFFGVVSTIADPMGQFLVQGIPSFALLLLITFIWLSRSQDKLVLGK